mmetsp:Transcript_46137/g.68746  ORF Transcript_46137/g.68746 Transcript_46137/m.68746 type:complete len:81 (-) Transcript_46137:10-252(-)
MGDGVKLVMGVATRSRTMHPTAIFRIPVVENPMFSIFMLSSTSLVRLVISWNNQLLDSSFGSHVVHQQYITQCAQASVDG